MGISFDHENLFLNQNLRHRLISYLKVNPLHNVMYRPSGIMKFSSERTNVPPIYLACDVPPQCPVFIPYPCWHNESVVSTVAISLYPSSSLPLLYSNRNIRRRAKEQLFQSQIYKSLYPICRDDLCLFSILCPRPYPCHHSM